MLWGRLDAPKQKNPLALKTPLRGPWGADERGASNALPEPPEVARQRIIGVATCDDHDAARQLRKLDQELEVIGFNEIRRAAV